MNADISRDVVEIGDIGVVPPILEVVCEVTGMGFAAIARVTEERWIACAVRDRIDFGLKPGDELDVQTTICHEIRDHRRVVTIDDVATDPEYCDHHTPRIYGLKSYISVPIILSDGSMFGTLCAISPTPVEVSASKTVTMFKLFAQMIASHIEAGRSVEKSETALLDEQETSALREQFIAVLGHDLRNPLAGIDAGVRMLKSEPLTDKGRTIVGLVETSVTRMAGLIDNVMDFARGRLGGGLTLSPTHDDLARTLRQIVSELQSSHPDSILETDIQAEQHVTGDHSRLGQLFSNLIGNALMHGDTGEPIRVALRLEDDGLVFETVNLGETISPQAMERLFMPFSRGEVRSSLQGLGLGLYISSQIAKAHGGTLSAESADRRTKFRFWMPLA